MFQPPVNSTPRLFDCPTFTNLKPPVPGSNEKMIRSVKSLRKKVPSIQALPPLKSFRSPASQPKLRSGRKPAFAKPNGLVTPKKFSERAGARKPVPTDPCGEKPVLATCQ